MKTLKLAFAAAFLSSAAYAAPPTESSIKEALHLADPYIQSWTIEATFGDVHLVSTSMGGNACPAMFRFAESAADHVALTEEFGTCSDTATAEKVGDEIRVTLPSFNASEGDVVFVYDGKVVSRQVKGLRSSGISDAEDWVGKSPYAFLTDADKEAGLIALLGWDTLDIVRNASPVSDAKGMVKEGEWITGTGCRPHMCDTDFIAVAIDAASGEAVIALKRDGEKAALFGEPKHALPTTIRSVLTE